MDRLREELLKRQGQMDKQAFVNQLGLDRPHYSVYIRGKRKLQATQARAFALAFPELRGLVCAEILGLPAGSCDLCLPLEDQETTDLPQEVVA